MLNMFRTLIYPSSGACDCVDELPHQSSCSVNTDDLALLMVYINLRQRAVMGIMHLCLDDF